MKRRTIREGVAIVFSVVLGGLIGNAQTLRRWTGTVGSNWFENANWDPTGVPVEGDTAWLGAGTLFVTNQTAGLGQFMMTGGTLVFSNWEARLIASNLMILTGTVTHVANSATNAPWDPDARVFFQCVNFFLGTAAVINVTEKGYRGGTTSASGCGPGGGIFYSGGYPSGPSHGGLGGSSPSYTYPRNRLPYDKDDEPALPGSGGATSQYGRGGHGGGVVVIEASDWVILNGKVIANGGSHPTDFTANHASGGAGGSIFIRCRRFAATNAVVEARGGNTASQAGASAGAGGRISIQYDPECQASGLVAGTRFSVAPGPWNNPGDMGTLYFTEPRFLEAENSMFSGQVVNATSWSVPALTITNSRIRFPSAGFRLSVTGDLVIAGPFAALEFGGRVDLPSDFYRADLFGVTSPVSLDVGGHLILTNGRSMIVYAGITNSEVGPAGARVSVGGDLAIYTGSVLSVKSCPTNGGSVSITARRLRLAPGGMISSLAAGFAGGTKQFGTGWGYGPGAGKDTSGRGGGGYGGTGGGYPTYGGATYGSPERPHLPGSGGSSGIYGRGGYGGGMIRIQVADLLQVDGTITVDGGLYVGNHSAGGSGGGIFLMGRRFQGSDTGRMTARGGNGYSSAYNDAGGGGGRIAVWFGDISDENVPSNRLVISTNPPPSYTGIFDVGGGTTYSGSRPGQPGTVQFIQVLRPAGTVIAVR